MLELPPKYHAIDVVPDLRAVAAKVMEIADVTAGLQDGSSATCTAAKGPLICWCSVWPASVENCSNVNRNSMMLRPPTTTPTQ